MKKISLFMTKFLDYIDFQVDYYIMRFASSLLLVHECHFMNGSCLSQ